MAIVCDFTVLRETYRRSAISPIDRWVGSSRSTRCSAVVSEAGPKLCAGHAPASSARLSAASCAPTPTAPGIAPRMASASSTKRRRPDAVAADEGVAGERDASLEVEPRRGAEQAGEVRSAQLAVGLDLGAPAGVGLDEHVERQRTRTVLANDAASPSRPWPAARRSPPRPTGRARRRSPRGGRGSWRRRAAAASVVSAPSRSRRIASASSPTMNAAAPSARHDSGCPSPRPTWR